MQNAHESLPAHQILILIGHMHKFTKLTVSEEETQGMGKCVLT
jgi:hypothetical protein